MASYSYTIDGSTYSPQKIIYAKKNDSIIVKATKYSTNGVYGLTKNMTVSGCTYDTLYSTDGKTLLHGLSGELTGIGIYYLTKGWTYNDGSHHWLRGGDLVINVLSDPDTPYVIDGSTYDKDITINAEVGDYISIVPTRYSTVGVYGVTSAVNNIPGCTNISLYSEDGTKVFHGCDGQLTKAGTYVLQKGWTSPTYIQGGKITLIVNDRTPDVVYTVTYNNYNRDNTIYAVVGEVIDIAVSGNGEPNYSGLISSTTVNVPSCSYINWYSKNYPSNYVRQLKGLLTQTGSYTLQKSHIGGGVLPGANTTLNVYNWCAKINFNLNTGSGEVEELGAGSNDTVKPSSPHTFTITNNVVSDPSLSGYTFVGWSKTQYTPGAGTAEYTMGSTIDVEYEDNSKGITLYAVWASTPNISYTVVLANYSTPNTIYANVGDTIHIGGAETYYNSYGISSGETDNVPGCVYTRVYGIAYSTNYVKRLQGTLTTPGTYTLTKALIGGGGTVEGSAITLIVSASTSNCKTKVNGQWKDGKAYVKVGGNWKESTAVYVKVGGVWKQNA